MPNMITGKNQFSLDCEKEDNQDLSGVFLNRKISLIKIANIYNIGPVMKIS